MLRNSTQKFRQKYHSHTKIVRANNNHKTEAFPSQKSLSIKAGIKLSKTRSTPKLQNTKSKLTLTQSLLMSKQKYTKLDRQQTICSNVKFEAQFIKSIVKRKGIEQSQVQSLKSGKLKRISKKKTITRNSEEFIELLPKDQIFFCSSCFQYVFQIQKRRHFPDCKQRVYTNKNDIHEVGIKKLQKIVELARYTGTKTNEIQEMYEHILKNNKKQVELMQQPPPYEFYTLQEINYAFILTYNKLLHNFKFKDRSFFDCY